MMIIAALGVGISGEVLLLAYPTFQDGIARKDKAPRLVFMEWEILVRQLQNSAPLCDGCLWLEFSSKIWAIALFVAAILF